MSKKNGHSHRQKWIKTKLELSRILGISRTTLDNFSTLPGFPERAANGHFPLEKCREFVVALTGRNEEKRQLELQRLRDDVARGQLELAKAAGEMMPIEMVSQTLSHWMICARKIIQGADISDQAKEAMTCAFEQIDCDEFLRQLSGEAGGSEGSTSDE